MLSNGICLSALHDKAFDQGLPSIDDDLTIQVSVELKKPPQWFDQKKELLLPEGRAMEPPERFSPGLLLIAWHRNTLCSGQPKMKLRTLPHDPDRIYYIMSGQPDCCPEYGRLLELLDLVLIDRERVFVNYCADCLQSVFIVED